MGTARPSYLAAYSHGGRASRDSHCTMSRMQDKPLLHLATYHLHSTEAWAKCLQVPEVAQFL